MIKPRINSMLHRRKLFKKKLNNVKNGLAAIKKLILLNMKPSKKIWKQYLIQLWPKFIKALEDKEWEV